MRSILVVEDDSDARTIYRDALVQRGYRVLTATQGAEGVYVARRQQPDLILLDLRMPVMDGLDALRYLKSDERTARIPVWGISAYLADVDRDDPHLGRFDRLLAKPVEPANLVSQIEGQFGPPPPALTN